MSDQQWDDFEGGTATFEAHPGGWGPKPNGKAEEQAKPEEPKPALRLRFGFDATTAEPLGTVVEGLLHAGSVTLIYGPPKSGKSFLATDLALSIAAKEPDWMGHKIVKPGPVLYVACEGHSGFWKRTTAAAKVRGWNRATFPKGFILATGRPMLIKADLLGHNYAPDPSAILAALETAKQQGMEPGSIIIDTVFRSIGAGNVNLSPDINAYLAAIASLSDRGYAVALVHHEIKAGGTPAGNVSLIGGSDNIVHVWRENEASAARFWQVEMAKDDAETEPRAFSLEIVPLNDRTEESGYQGENSRKGETMPANNHVSAATISQHLNDVYITNSTYTYNVTGAPAMTFHLSGTKPSATNGSVFGSTAHLIVVDHGPESFGTVDLGKFSDVDIEGIGTPTSYTYTPAHGNVSGHINLFYGNLPEFGFDLNIPKGAHITVTSHPGQNADGSYGSFDITTGTLVGLSYGAAYAIYPHVA